MQKAKQFLTKNLAIRLLPLILVGWFAQSCNNSVVVEDDPPPPPPTRTVDSLPIYSLGGEAFLPDSASWKIGKDSGKATFINVKVVSKDTAIVAAKLDHKTFTDTLKIQYWKFGVLIQTRLYLSNGNDLPRAVNPGGKIFQSSNSLLMAAFYEAHGKDSVQYPLTRAGFLASYANMVLTGNTKANFPAGLPAGITQDTIRIIVIQLAVKRNIVATDLVNTQLGLDRTQLLDLVDKLIGAKILDPGVKDKLFPPSSIKWEETFGVEATSVKQGENLGLKGKVSSGSKWTSVSIEVLNKENLSVTSQFAITSPKDSTTLIFGGVAKLIPSADLGTYTVRFSGKNEKNETTSQQATFEVVKSDDPEAVLAPRITRLQPSGKDSTLSFGTEAVVVKWKVKDDSRYEILASVINGMEAKLGADSTYSVEIKLAPGKDSVVWLKSTSSSKKFSIDSVTVRRAKDGEKPKFAKLDWAIDSFLNTAGAYEFGKDEVTVNLKWEIEDNYKFHPDSAACIIIAGKVASCLEVKLPDPKNALKGVVSYDYKVPNLYSAVTLRVKDAAGNFDDYKVDFVRPQKEGDIPAEWDRFNWDAPKVVWQ